MKIRCCLRSVFCGSESLASLSELVDVCRDQHFVCAIWYANMFITSGLSSFESGRDPRLKNYKAVSFLDLESRVQSSAVQVARSMKQNDTQYIPHSHKFSFAAWPTVAAHLTLLFDLSIDR